VSHGFSRRVKFFSNGEPMFQVFHIEKLIQRKIDLKTPKLESRSTGFQEPA